MFEFIFTNLFGFIDENVLYVVPIIFGIFAMLEVKLSADYEESYSQNEYLEYYE